MSLIRENKVARVTAMLILLLWGSAAAAFAFGVSLTRAWAGSGVVVGVLAFVALLFDISFFSEIEYEDEPDGKPEAE